MTIVIITHNQKAELQICIEAIFKFWGMDDVSLLVIDIASNDGTEEWLEQQKLAYGVAQESEGFAQILNEAIEMFGLDDDLLIMRPNCVITPNCLKNMLQVLYEKEEIAIVEPRINAQSYEEAIREACGNSSSVNSSGNYQYMLGLQDDILLLKRDAMVKLGVFDVRLKSREGVYADYGMRALTQGYKIARADNAIVYNMLGGFCQGRSLQPLLDRINHKEEENVNVLVINCDYETALLEITDRWKCASVYNDLESATDKFFDYIIYGSVLPLNEGAEILKSIMKLYIPYLKEKGRVLVKFPVALSGEKLIYSYEDLYAFCYRNDILIADAKAEEFPENGKRMIGYAAAMRPKRGKKLLILSAGGNLLEYSMQMVAEAYEQLGWEVFCRTKEEFHSGEVKRLIQEGIHKVFVFNNVGWIFSLEEGGENQWDKLGITSINFIFDHPMYYDATLKNAPKLGTLVCVDRNHVQYVKRFYPNIKNVMFMPLAGDNRLDGYYGKRWNDRNIEVLYVGGYKEDLDISLLPEGGADILADLLADRTQTTEYVIERHFRKNEGSVKEEQVKEEIIRCKKVDWFLMTYIRVEVIRALVKGGVNVTVCGPNWEKFEYFDSPHFIYGGFVTQEECLEKMKDSKIVLNVMPWFKDGIHDRVINAMLAGAVSLTDNSAYMESVLEKDKDYVCFELEHLEELPEIVRKILQSDNEEVRLNAYNKAKEKHCWIQRIKELENG